MRGLLLLFARHHHQLKASMKLNAAKGMSMPHCTHMCRDFRAHLFQGTWQSGAADIKMDADKRLLEGHVLPIPA